MADGDMNWFEGDEWCGLFHELAARLPDLEHLEAHVESTIDQRYDFSGRHGAVRQKYFEGSTTSCQNTIVLPTSRSCDGWAPRSCQSCHDSVNIRDFLQEHQKPLRNLCFLNIFFADKDVDGEGGIEDGMQQVSKAMSEMIQLQFASIFIPRLEDMPEVQISEPHADFAKLYLSADGEKWKWYTVIVFDKLAEELGIPSDGFGWNFAKHIVPQKGLGSPAGD